MKKILICSDKFKGSLTSHEVNVAIAEGILESKLPALCDLVNVSDGGDGFLDSISEVANLFFDTVDALNNPIVAKVGYKNKTIFIEIALVIGLSMLKNNTGNIKDRSSFGLGKLIFNILDSEIEFDRIVIGCGGTSTNDAGFGALIGLGVQFLDNKNNQLLPFINQICQIKKINLSKIHPRLQKINIDIVSDVSGPLLGIDGSTNTFAKQKGATNEDISFLENSIEILTNKIKQELGVDINDCIHGICSGGIPAGFSILQNINYLNGSDFVIRQCQLELKIAYSDIVISGEGMVDDTTFKGKIVYKIAQLCKQHQKPLILIAGQINTKIDDLYKNGVTAAFPIINHFPYNNLYDYENSTSLIKTRIKDLIKFSIIFNH